MRKDKLSLPEVTFLFGLLAVSSIFLLVIGTMGFLTRSGQSAPPVTERIAYCKHLPEHSRPLIAAIRRFQEDQGSPPASLDDLVPKYLAKVPDTGLARFPEYEYKVLSKDEQVPVIWYDLGPPPPGSPPVQRHYLDVDPADHVLLLLTSREDARHNLFTTDGLSYNPGTEAFNAQNWHADRASRIRMARSLIEQYHNKLKTKADALDLLGESDGEGVVHDTPWELSVSCTWDKWHPDKMLYRPTRKYWRAPGWVFPVGDWLYIRGD